MTIPNALPPFIPFGVPQPSRKYSVSQYNPKCPNCNESPQSHVSYVYSPKSVCGLAIKNLICYCLSIAFFVAVLTPAIHMISLSPNCPFAPNSMQPKKTTNLLERDETRRVSCTNTGTTVLDWRAVERECISNSSTILHEFLVSCWFGGCPFGGTY